MTTTGPAATPNRTRRERSTTHLLDVAEQLFVESGYAATSVERIATQASLTKGAVYFYFGSKEGLLDALLARAEESVFEPPLAILRAEGTSAAVRLSAYFDHLGASISGARRYLLAVTVSLQLDAVPGPARHRVEETFAATERAVAEVIEQGRQAGEFSAQVRAKEAAAVIQALVVGMLLQWQRESADLDGREFLRTGRHALLAGLTTTS